MAIVVEILQMEDTIAIVSLDLMDPCVKVRTYRFNGAMFQSEY